MKLDAILRGESVMALARDGHKKVVDAEKKALREAGNLVQRHHKQKEWIGGTRGKRGGIKLKELDTHPDKLTIRRGGPAGLRGSYGLRFDWSKMEVYYGSDKEYSRIHEFGGMAGRGRSVYIPPRPGLLRTIKATEERVQAIFGKQIDKGLEL